MYVNALKSTQDLVQVEDHVKNYRPQLLVLSGKSRSPKFEDLRASFFFFQKLTI